VVLVGSQAEDGECTERDADPRRVSIALAGGDGCIAQARRHAADFLTRLRDKHGLDISGHPVGMTQLVVSELVTNALKYAPGPVLMELRVTGAQVEISVRDSSPAMPGVQPTDPDRVGRHGLEIVRAVTQALDIRREPGGKRITARIALNDGPGADTPGRDVP
jgi:anti-sigma regulatory factor (Ser/Thr protein kinase)